MPRRIVAYTLLLLALSCRSAVAADCFQDAAVYQHVNPLILHAIAWQESHDHAAATHANANGTIDVGSLQINSIHFAKLAGYGIRPTALYDECVNVYVAAWLLKQKMIKYGNTWQAVGAYHSETPDKRDSYARAIETILVSWGKLDRVIEPPAAVGSSPTRRE
jgi:soluble lytic murein transglycosylase-like protein